MYMKKTDSLYRSRTCAKCGTFVADHEIINSSVPRNVSICNNSNDTCSAAILNHSLAPSHNVTYQIAIESQPMNSKEIGSLAVLREINMATTSTAVAVNKLPFGDMSDQVKYQTCVDDPSNMQALNNLYKTSGLVNNRMMDHSLGNEEDDDDKEPTPYATFNLSGFDSDNGKAGDAYEIYAGKFSEPPYMLLKKSLEYPPQYEDSVDYKLLNSVNKCVDENVYQSSQCHSITSCSSNHEELAKAYEYGKLNKIKLMNLQNKLIETLNESDTSEAYYPHIPSDKDSPTDPGMSNCIIFYGATILIFFCRDSNVY